MTDLLALENVRQQVIAAIDHETSALRELNRDIHSHPETAYEEVYAHERLSGFLEDRGFSVTRHAYGLDTSFEAEFATGEGGPLVIFCAEYDALPGIGHGCGHNLIATSSMAAFLGLTQTLRQLNLTTPVRVRILGTPAEEGGGGKIKLIEAGAFKDPEIVAAIMAHPTSIHGIPDGYTGIAGFPMIASSKLRVEYRGQGAHAGGDPWNGRNALDAAVGAYNNISMLRQQIQPDERIHGVIEVGGVAPNVIPDYTRMNWNVRSATAASAEKLLSRAKACFEAAALATGCEVEYIMPLCYKDVVINDTFCEFYTSEMEALGRNVLLRNPTAATVSTDMGNVSHEVPGFHGVFGIPTAPNIPGHHAAFAEAAATDEAHAEAILSAKAMAMLGWLVITRNKN
ncbi:aminoacylase 1-like 2 [Aspergillus ustus]|uniref:Peptidase M20 domain-containing protein 2 n=1 Tax=Aspergillus ustus TaxID=40382 RepID=A0A0C1C3D1_ASPUT|nr:aminoacylase 1-like 2 [Aspergillus ustus]